MPYLENNISGRRSRRLTPLTRLQHHSKRGIVTLIDRTNYISRNTTILSRPLGFTMAKRFSSKKAVEKMAKALAEGAAAESSKTSSSSTKDVVNDSDKSKVDIIEAVNTRPLENYSDYPNTTTTSSSPQDKTKSEHYDIMKKQAKEAHEAYQSGQKSLMQSAKDAGYKVKAENDSMESTNSPADINNNALPSVNTETNVDPMKVSYGLGKIIEGMQNNSPTVLKEEHKEMNAITQDGSELVINHSSKKAYETPQFLTADNIDLNNPLRNQTALYKELEERGIIDYAHAHDDDGTKLENTGSPRLTKKGHELLQHSAHAKPIIRVEKNSMEDNEMSFESASTESQHKSDLDIVTLAINDDASILTPEQTHNVVVERDERNIPGVGKAVVKLTSEKGTKKGVDGISGPKNTVIHNKQIAGNDKTQFGSAIIPPLKIEPGQAEIRQENIGYTQMHEDSEIFTDTIPADVAEKRFNENVENEAKLAQIRLIAEQSKEFEPMEYSSAGIQEHHLEDLIVLDKQINSNNAAITNNPSENADSFSDDLSQDVD